MHTWGAAMCRLPSAWHSSELASSVSAAAAPQTAPVHAMLAVSDDRPSRPAGLGTAAALRSCFIWRKDLPTTRPCHSAAHSAPHALTGFKQTNPDISCHRLSG